MSRNSARRGIKSAQGEGIGVKPDDNHDEFQDLNDSFRKKILGMTNMGLALEETDASLCNDFAVLFRKRRLDN